MSNEKQVSSEATLGMKLVQKTKELMREQIEEHGSLDEHWDLDVDKEIVEEEVYTSDELFEKFQDIFNNLWDDCLDQVTYELRQAEADRRDRERTDRRAYSAEKNRVANKINSKYN